jgi:hypothetical protein
VSRVAATDDAVLQALLRKRIEIYTWLDSPVKQAFLAKINRMIEGHLQTTRRVTRRDAASAVGNRTPRKNLPPL